MPEPLNIKEKRLSAATEALIDGVNGAKHAMAITGKGASQIYNYASCTSREFMPIHHVAALEAVAVGSAGHPQVTKVLCEMAGGVFVPLPQFEGSDADAMALIACALAELGDVSRVLIDDLADGKLDPEGCQRALRELADVERVTAQLRMALEKIANRGR